MRPTCSHLVTLTFGIGVPIAGLYRSINTHLYIYNTIVHSIVYECINK